MYPQTTKWASKEPGASPPKAFQFIRGGTPRLPYAEVWLIWTAQVEKFDLCWSMCGYASPWGRGNTPRVANACGITRCHSNYLICYEWVAMNFRHFLRHVSKRLATFSAWPVAFLPPCIVLNAMQLNSIHKCKMPPATINSSIDAQGKCQLLSWRFEACKIWSIILN